MRERSTAYGEKEEAERTNVRQVDKGQRKKKRAKEFKYKLRTSKIITVSAVSRLIPKPPARVESKKAKSWELGALNCAMARFLWSDGTVPVKKGKKKILV